MYQVELTRHWGKNQFVSHIFWAEFKVHWNQMQLIWINTRFIACIFVFALQVTTDSHCDCKAWWWSEAKWSNSIHLSRWSSLSSHPFARSMFVLMIMVTFGSSAATNASAINTIISFMTSGKLSQWSQHTKHCWRWHIPRHSRVQVWAWSKCEPYSPATTTI